MFLKSLHIDNGNGIVRHITFHSGLNLVVDETPTGDLEATGNNVGKTTVLKLIDFCLGGNAKDIYTDPENRKNENIIVKNFLQNTNVVVSLRLTSDLTDLMANEVLIERNFASRKGIIRKINGRQLIESEFLDALTEAFFPGQAGKKPTLSQIIAHNIRYKDISLSNTLRNVHAMTKDEEYEALHLFMLGCNFGKGEERQKILSMIRIETAFKARLENFQTRSAYEASLAIILREINELNERKAKFQISPTSETDLKLLEEIKYKISSQSSDLSQAVLRRELILEATADIGLGRVDIDTQQLKEIYSEASSQLAGINKKFSELLSFHNRMVEEKVRYISKEIPALEFSIKNKKKNLSTLLINEKNLIEKISLSGSLDELEIVGETLNEKSRRRGEFETIISQIRKVESQIGNLDLQLAGIDEDLFSLHTQAMVQTQVDIFNKYFSRISQELYDEQYVLKFDIVTTKSGKRVYKFNTFNMNMSSGKKQGEITCFDIAYTLFADGEGIPCLHFLLNDKKELMHDNQLMKIAKLVEKEHTHVQFVASILRDKLPPELNKEDFFVVKLSQHEMLFKI